MTTATARPDTAALTFVSSTSVPIAAGLLTAAVSAPLTDALITGGVLVVWLLVALPVAVWVGRRLHDMQPPPFNTDDDEEEDQR